MSSERHTPEEPSLQRPPRGLQWSGSFSDSFSTADTFTATSESSRTVGIGMVSGRMLMALGETALSAIETFVIRRRLATISMHVQSGWSKVVADHLVEEMFDDLLELSRPTHYEPEPRDRAWVLIIRQVNSGMTSQLRKSLLKWPLVEVQLFAREFMSSKYLDLFFPLGVPSSEVLQGHALYPDSFLRFARDLAFEVDRIFHLLNLGILDTILEAASNESAHCHGLRGDDYYAGSAHVQLCDELLCRPDTSGHPLIWNALCDHSLSLLWPFVHASQRYSGPNLDEQPDILRAVAWRKMKPGLVERRIKTIEMVFDWYTSYRLWRPSRPQLLDTCLDLLEFSKSGIYHKALQAQALFLLKQHWVESLDFREAYDACCKTIGIGPNIASNILEYFDSLNTLPTIDALLSAAHILVDRYASQGAYEQALSLSDSQSANQSMKVLCGTPWAHTRTDSPTRSPTGSPTGSPTSSPTSSLNGSPTSTRNSSPLPDDRSMTLADGDTPADAPVADAAADLFDELGRSEDGDDIGNGEAPRKMHVEEDGFDGDRVLANEILFLQDAGWWTEAAYAIPEGDVGWLWEIMKIWIFSFAGASNHNYVTYLLDMYCLIRYESSKEMSDGIFNNWLVNLTGELGKWIEADLMQEHYNRWIEDMVKKKGGDFDDAFYRKTLAPNVIHFLHIKEVVESAFDLKPRSKSHTSPHLRNEFQQLLRMHKEDELHSFRSGRTLGHAAVNYLDRGFQWLQAGRLSDFLEQSTAYVDILASIQKTKETSPVLPPLSTETVNDQPDSAMETDEYPSSLHDAHSDIAAPFLPSQHPAGDFSCPRDSEQMDENDNSDQHANSNTSSEESSSESSVESPPSLPDDDDGEEDMSEEHLVSGKDHNVFIDSESGEIVMDWGDRDEVNDGEESDDDSEIELDDEQDPESSSDEDML